MWALDETEIRKCNEIVSSKFQRNINSDFGQDQIRNINSDFGQVGNTTNSIGSSIKFWKKYVLIDLTVCVNWLPQGGNCFKSLAIWSLSM